MTSTAATAVTAASAASSCPCQCIQSHTCSANAITNTSMCPVCIDSALQSHRARRATAKRNHAEMKRWCQQRLCELRAHQAQDYSEASSDDAAAAANATGSDVTNITNTTNTYTSDKCIPSASLSELQANSTALRLHLSQLRQQCHQRSVQTAQLALSNQTRHDALYEKRAEFERGRTRLDAVWVGVLGDDDDGDAAKKSGDFDGNEHKSSSSTQGAENDQDQASASAPASAIQMNRNSVIGDGLPGALTALSSEIRVRRLRLALKAFDMHRIDPGSDNLPPGKEGKGKEKSKADSTTSSGHKRNRSRRPQGVGKICGLPLPHAGPALYGVLPPAVLASSLRLVASLTGMLSRCLGLEVPHLILLRPLIMPGGTAGSSGSTSGSRSKMVARAEAMERAAQRKECGDIVEIVSSNGVGLGDTSAVLDNIRFLNLNEGDEAEGTLKKEPDVNGNAVAIAKQSLVSSSTSIRSLGRATARWALAKATGHSSTESISKSSSSASTAANTSVAASRITMPISNNIHQSAAAAPSYSNVSSKSRPSPLPANKLTVAARIRHASTAVLRENADGTGGGEYALLPPTWSGAPTRSTASAAAASASTGSGDNKNVSLSPHDEFSTALQLLQNDVVALCIRAEMSPDDMWPAEALLLNLEALRNHLRAKLSLAEEVCVV